MTATAEPSQETDIPGSVVLHTRLQSILSKEAGEPRTPVLTGDDWPKIDFAKPRYHTAPTNRQRNRELGLYAVYLAQDAGLLLDPWEEWYLLESLDIQPDGKWSALECGLCVPRQNGKGDQSLDTPLLTMDGWTTMRDIQVGQYVYGSDGNPTRVVARSEVFLGNDCYEVEFTDGATSVVGAGHLWHAKRQYRSNWQTVTTEELANDVGKRGSNGKMGYHWRVRCDAVVQTPVVKLPLDPYIFGYWLGDGSHKGPEITTGREDFHWVRQSLEKAGYRIVRVDVRKPSKHFPGTAFHIHFNINAQMRDGFESRIKRLGVWGNKHIPEIFLQSSPSQRKMLLRGLMDSDGTIATTNRSPQVAFSSSNPRLTADFHRLVRSLGIKAVVKQGVSASLRDSWGITWTPRFQSFKLPRKAEKFKPPVSNRDKRMSIVAVRRVPSVPTRCIQVAAEDGVYLTGTKFTPTHNSILEARELLALFPPDERKFPNVGVRLAVHTAHEAKTAHEGFERLAMLIEGRPRLRAKLRGKPRQSEGGEVIRIVGNRRIRFRTRTSGGGRGLSGELLIFDEAMILMQGVHEAVWPIVTAMANPQIWYAGSAVDKNEPLMDEHGIVFARVRKRGIKGDPDLLYGEWSLGTAEGKDYESPDEVPPEIARDPESWALTNPGLDVRLSRRVITVEQRSLSHRGFVRERCGVGAWPDPDQSNRVIDEEKWRNATVDQSSVMQDPVCFAVDVSPDRSRAAIGVAGKNPGGKNQVEVVKRFRSTAKVVPTLVELVKQHGRRTEIVIDGVGSAASLIPEMELEKLQIVSVTGGEYARGCGMFFDGVTGDDEKNIPTTLNHLGDPALNAAVAGAVKRPLGERWAWNRKDSTVDISPLVAVTLALYGLLRKRQSVPGVYSAAELLDEAEETSSLDESVLPPLEEEDL